MVRLEPISAAAQFRAVAYLRGRLFVNGFRRKGGRGDLIARILLYPVMAAIAAVPIAAAGLMAYSAIHNGHPEWLAFVFWGTFLLWQVVSINVAPPTLAFEPESLIRFPLSAVRYLAIRLLLGLLSASTVIGVAALLAATAGVGIAEPGLLLPAAAVALCFAVSNILFTRMVFAWVDRWLSTRRAREIFTGFVFLFGISMQYLNVTFNGIGKHMTRAERVAKVAGAEHILRTIQPVAARLPPGLAARALADSMQHHLFGAVAELGGLLAYAGLFLAVFAWRMQREYRGERLSDAAVVAPVRPAASRVQVISSSLAPERSFGFPPVLAAIFRKELLYVRRNTSQFYGLAAPVLMVVIFAGRLGSFSRTGYGFPAGLVYSLLGLAAFSYNSFGLEHAGVQLYFLAPIRIRSVLLAKNLLSFAITAIQVLAIYLVVTYAAGPPPARITAVSLLWVVFATLTNTALGNLRSLVAPKKMDPGRLARKQASQLSALMGVLLMVGSAAFAAGLYLAGERFGLLWLPFVVLAACAAAAALFYLRVLDRTDEMALKHRETLIEALCKTA